MKANAHFRVIAASAMFSVVLAVPTFAHASESSDPQCADSTSGQSGSSGFLIGGQRSCEDGLPGSSGPVVVVRVVDCGPVQVVGHVLVMPGDVCGQVANTCAVAADSVVVVDPLVTTRAVEQQQPDGSWVLVDTRCAVRTATPQLSALLVTEQVRRLVPRPGIGVAPPGGATLVNLQTVLWVDTAVDRELGSVALLGHRVALRVHVERVDWGFGDGQVESTPVPEPAYDPARGCRTVTCPGYWGHVYTRTGVVTVSAATTWSGEYNVDGTGWLAIPSTVTGPAQTLTLSVREARGVLVDPTGH